MPSVPCVLVPVGMVEDVEATVEEEAVDVATWAAAEVVATWAEVVAEAVSEEAVADTKDAEADVAVTKIKIDFQSPKGIFMFSRAKMMNVSLVRGSESRTEVSGTYGLAQEDSDGR